MGKRKEKRQRYWIGFLIFMISLSALTSVRTAFVNAAEQRMVKVAFFPMDGYHELGEDGSYGGMDVEYLNAICEYTDWKIDYVPCDSWEAALQLLQEQQVDLVGSAQYSYERSQTYQYADLSSGYTFGVIAVNGDSALAYEDFAAMQELTFGMVEGYVRQGEFLQYMQDHGIETPIVVKYNTTAKLQEALQTGEIDALVHTFTEVKEGQRLVGRFAPRPFYYITYPGNDDVMRELNQAIADLKMQKSELENTLMNEFYYERFDHAVLLTTEEKAYIEQTGNLRVGYVDGLYPFSYEENGEFTGLTHDLLEAGLGAVGLRVDYRLFDSLQAAKDALQAGEIDVLSFCAATEQKLSEQGLKRVCEYAKAPMVLVMKDGNNLSNMKVLAVVANLEHKAGNSVNLDEIELKTYESPQECLDAVKAGAVDAVLCGGYLAEHLLKTDIRYNNLHIESVLSGEYDISLAIREDAPAQLEGILDKVIADIDLKMINEYMLKGSTYPLVTISDFIREHSIGIIGFLCTALVVLFLVARHIILDGRKIQDLMYKDTKMNIWNLNYLIFSGEHRLLPESKEKYAVVYINLAQFRHFNVIYGWNAGERLLENIADILKRGVDKKSEIAARDQGDRFVLLLCYSDREELSKRLKKLKADIENWIYEDSENRMSIRMGVYLISPEESDLHLAINYANQVLEFMDEGQENEIRIYDATMEEKIKERHERERLLESVDVSKDFTVYYQSKVDIRNNEIVGAEALVRFLDPSDGGRVRAPGYFVPYYEQTGRITEIDFFVLEEVCKLLRRRIDEGKRIVPISCNFSRMHFAKPGFPERFECVLEKYQIDKEMIEVEVTETLIIEELQHNMVKQTLEVLRERGIRLSIDDFGAGYSSLGVFEQIPASVIKLDRSFLLNQKDRGRQVKIMRGIVKMSEDLSAQIVCEGVETDDDIELMEEIGAYLAQGYYYSKPIPDTEFETKLSAKIIA